MMNKSAKFGGFVSKCSPDIEQNAYLTLRYHLNKLLGDHARMPQAKFEVFLTSGFRGEDV